MTELWKLHKSLGLHERIEVIYVVDGYIAQLHYDDLDKEPTSSDVCETISLALLDLESRL